MPAREAIHYCPVIAEPLVKVEPGERASKGAGWLIIDATKIVDGAVVRPFTPGRIQQCQLCQTVVGGFVFQGK